ncbi:hypothetical protein D9611_003072 [Ephemerocybe angulata]|uniref:Heparinase II/III-like C-terminal domain-containing protein n=1 Tax=Ephemerocybe angulata TaxID=980116 RepID=A0A8H5FI19_9AGAR|nr:hypothetical protein D9611_003072 [Tulosesus angulatus]
MSYGAVPQNNSGRSPYGNTDLAYTESSTGFINPRGPTKKKGVSPWIKFGVPVLIVVIIAAVVGGILGSKAGKKDGSSSTKSGGSSSDPDASVDPKAPIQTATDILVAGRFATATQSKYMIPIYPSATNTVLFVEPTIAAGSKKAWPEDTFKPSNPSPTQVREDRPRIIAPQYKWDALPNLIRSDPYLQTWNDTILKNATDYMSKQPITYAMDGDSGILDNAREFKMRIKAFGYAYHMTQNTRWVDRAWEEIQHVISDDFGPANDTKWNPTHFLDTAEFSAAFGIAYDWMYAAWTDDQKKTIREGLIEYGLKHGAAVYAGGTTFGWWTSNITGNWNCVCNGGLTIGALAILGDDTTSTASGLLGKTIDNAKANCALAVMSDGSWAESPNYWYFGTTGHAEMSSALLTATGSHYGLLDVNADYWRTGTFHMHVYGPTSLFDYGDHGPNKFSTTANSMMLYGDLLDHPEFILHQRDRADSAEPWSMFWYDPAVAGAYWSNQKLDHFFENPRVQWAAMRSSWTDDDALYIAIKAGQNKGHQTHNDLDVGDFVLDALGTRWAGELGSADYLYPQYFASQEQNAERWKWYRKATVGQNTIVVNNGNQNVESAPTVKHDTSDTAQGSSTVLSIPKDSTAFWTADMTSAYFDATSVKRGARMLNGRTQILLQDEITATGTIQWRMHTNATVALDSATTATLSLDGQVLKVSMVSPPDGAEFVKLDPVRPAGMPEPLEPDQPNPGVTVLAINLPAGSHTLQVLFNPQWPGMKESDYVVPKTVALDSWSLRSHD